MTSFQPSGVITITTDFGHKGPYVGVMKGVIVERFKAASIIDLTHEIPAHWPTEAGFWLSHSYRYFPQGSVHLAIVDPGVGTERDILLAEHDGHLFIAPDNGLLASMLDRSDACVVYALAAEALDAIRVRTPSPTFHGRDIFAPLAAEIAAARIQPGQVGRRVSEWTPAWIDNATVSPQRLGGVIVTVDAFGNLISNIEESMLAGISAPRVQLAGHSFALQTTYGRCPPGEYLALINSFGVLEIARAEGNAAEGLGSERGAPVVVTAG